MCSRLRHHLKINNILYKYQFGFRNNHSTTLALIEVVDNILKYLDDGEKVIGIYIDLQKAFDTVNHEILLHKLYNYGVRGVAHEWFRNYLTGRCQFTSMNNVNSGLANTTCGVPQGSVLGPLLFLIYINDIPNAIPNETVKLFADDTNLFIAGNTLSSVSELANKNIKLLCGWFLANKLTLNIDKTRYMVFPPEANNTVNIAIDGIEIQHVRSCRYLGLIIDDELKWTEHIEHVYKKILKYSSIFNKLRDKLPLQILTNINLLCICSLTRIICS